MRGHRLRLTVVLGVLALASGTIWWAAPQGAAQQGPLNCTFRTDPPQPEHPLELNTVVSDPRTSQFRDPLIKHVIMEKEVYQCVENEGTPEERRFDRDVETFIEIIQRVQGGRTIPVEKRVEELVCDKSNRGAFGFPEFSIDCSARDVPLQEGPVNLRCDLPGTRGQPMDPVDMDTVITARQDTVKTFKVDKEIIVCADPQQQLAFFGGLYLFTEIVEVRGAAAGGVDTIRPTEKKFQAILCLSDEDTASPQSGRIGSCFHFVPGGPPPPA